MFWNNKQTPKVFLVMYDGDLVVSRATKTQSGYIASWCGDNWSLLLPDGKVRGTRLVREWLPHSNCEDLTKN